MNPEPGREVRFRPNPSAWALQRPALTLFLILVIAAAGIWAYGSLGRAEDPGYTIKQMVIATGWPGASAVEMTRYVTDPIERKLEELPSLDFTESYSQHGRSTIVVSLKDSTPPAKVPDLWYQVRKKIDDIRPGFPEGIQGPYFNDEFGDVFGIIYAFTSESFTLPELKHVVEDARERLLSVPSVGKVQLLGVQDERIYVDISFAKLARLGLTAQDIFRAIRRENSMVASGYFDTARDRIYITTNEGIGGVAALRKLPLAAHGHLIQLSDIATVTRGTVDPPVTTLRVNGKPALGLAISMADGGDILELGRRIDQRMSEITPTLPLGVTVTRVNDQPAVVAKDVGEFQKAFVAALGIVLMVSLATLGWRAGLVVAVSVLLVLAGTFVGMRLLGIDLQRVSLGTLIIALGLLVDDAIIAVEMFIVKLSQGWDRVRAGSFVYQSTAFPMLTGTLVTVVGYLPVGFAQSDVGEYTRDIFRVLGMALILSWIVAVLFVPYLASALIPAASARRHADHRSDPYASRGYRCLARVLAWCVRQRRFVLAVTVIGFALSVFGFLRVPQQFFPSSDRLEVVLDMRLPEGSSFAATAADVEKMETILAHSRGIASYVAYTGVGSPRFFLGMAPELESPNFAQFVVHTTSVPAREALLRKLGSLSDAGAAGGFADVRLRAAPMQLGPPVGYPLQFRIIGPDLGELRKVAGSLRQALRANPHVRNVNDNWGDLAKAVSVHVDREKARLLGLSGQDISGVLDTLLQGTPISAYRENTDLIPIIGRAVDAERRNLDDLPEIDIQSSSEGAVPLSQIATVGYGLEEPILWRRNRSPMLVVRAEIRDGLQAPDVVAELRPVLAGIETRLPEGYRIETGGAVEASAKGQSSVNALIPVMVLATLALLMVQLQSFSRVVMVILTAPLSLIGVTSALLLSGSSFGFVAMLGVIALSGIVMRNSIILVDQIERDVREGIAPGEAIVRATVRRARPVVLTAAAAALAMIPLGVSPFWGPMAIAIMGGLVTATALTLLVVPALYAVWAGVPRARDQATGSQSPIGFANRGLHLEAD